MPHRITGRDKCPREGCHKEGRYNPKPMVSWNSKFDTRTGKKRAYMQFIHNDGTRHNIGSVEEPLLIQVGNLLHKIANASLTQEWKWKEGEEERLLSALNRGDFRPTIRKYQEYKKNKARNIYERYVNYDTDEKKRIDKLTKRVIDEASLQAKRYPHEDPKAILTRAFKNALGLKEEELSTNDDVKKVFIRIVEQRGELNRRNDETLSQLKVVEMEINKRKRY